MRLFVWLRRRIAQIAGNLIVQARRPPRDLFLGYHYQRHNQRRQEHLATLGLNIHGRSVLEVGAGIGDHTSFFLDRSCVVTATEPRKENLLILRERYPEIRVLALDLDDPNPNFQERFEVVYCYGTLYHLSRPEQAIEYIAQRCGEILLLETCVSFGEEDAVNLVDEAMANPTQAVAGQGCRPTRRWVFDRLRRQFPNVYVPRTQPNHPEFPLTWRIPPQDGRLTRAVFVASRSELASDLLVAELPLEQLVSP